MRPGGQLTLIKRKIINGMKKVVLWRGVSELSVR